MWARSAFVEQRGMCVACAVMPRYGGGNIVRGGVSAGGYRGLIVRPGSEGGLVVNACLRRRQLTVVGFQQAGKGLVYNAAPVSRKIDGTGLFQELPCLAAYGKAVCRAAHGGQAISAVVL